jgi:hypothetical protein
VPRDQQVHRVALDSLELLASPELLEAKARQGQQVTLDLQVLLAYQEILDLKEAQVGYVLRLLFCLVKGLQFVSLYPRGRTAMPFDAKSISLVCELSLITARRIINSHGDAML